MTSSRESSSGSAFDDAETQPRFVSRREAARLLGVSDASILRWLHANRLPGIQVHGRWLIPLSGLRQLETSSRARVSAHGEEVQA